MSLFIKPNDTLGANASASDTFSYDYISKPLATIIPINRMEDFFILSQNSKEKEISSYLNKNNHTGLSFGNEVLLTCNTLKHIYKKNHILLNLYIYSVSYFLQHAIYTRAP